jgi:anti-sigma-K factor RskA
MSADPGAGTPIACSLDAGSLADRVEEWRALVATSVVEVEAEPTGVYLVLEPSEEALVAAVELAQREKQCCPFFDVALEVGAQRRTLSLRVPQGAEEAMATFVAMLTP